MLLRTRFWVTTCQCLEGWDLLEGQVLLDVAARGPLIGTGIFESQLSALGMAEATICSLLGISWSAAPEEGGSRTASPASVSQSVQLSPRLKHLSFSSPPWNGRVYQLFSPKLDRGVGCDSLDEYAPP